MQSIVVACLLAFALSTPALASDFHISPTGSPSATGSASAPWDLQTALRQPAAVHPGDTLWLHAGTYRGRFECTLAGTPDKPITLRQAPNERATIDCAPFPGQTQPPYLDILATAHDVTFWGFEVTCTDPKRTTTIKGSWPDNIKRGGINCRASRIKFINLIVHDTAQGFSWWAEGEAGEIYGCLIYYNGWQAPDRAHGHAIYTQNKTGTKRIVDNLIFAQFSHGIHAYGSNKAFLNGYHIEGNACFNNGALARDGRSPDLLVGGGCPAERIAVLDNVLYQDAGTTTLRLGYGAANKDLALRGNLVAGFTDIKDWTTLELKSNTFISPGTLLQLSLPKGIDPKTYTWDQNTYIRTKTQWSPFILLRDGASKGLTWQDWQPLGLDAHGKYSEGPSDTVRVIVRPNAYEPGRAHILVLNPAKRPHVEADLSKVLQPGARYQIVRAEDYFGAPIAKGTYTGANVSIPMEPTKPAPPVGDIPGKLTLTSEFGAFIVLPIN